MKNPSSLPASDPFAVAAVGKAPPEGWKKHRRPPKATIVSVALLILFHVVVFFLFTLPDRRLPILLQRVVAVADAALAASIVPFAVSELAKKNKKFTYSKGKKASTSKVLGSAVFVLFFGMWFTPLAPIKIGVPAAEDVANWLAHEMTVVTLALPDRFLATVDLPAPPRHATKVAAMIPETAPPFAMAMKALAEARYADAQQFLELVGKSGEVEPLKFHLACGQLETFAGRCWNAPPWFEKAVADAPSDLHVLCQAACSYAVAGDFKKATELGQTLLDRAEADSSQATTMLPIALNLMAAVHTCQGRFQDAEALNQQAQLIWKDSAAARIPHAEAHIAASRNNQAVMYVMFPGKYAGAESQFQAADDGWRAAYGEQSARAASGQANLGVLYTAENRFMQAEAAFEQAVAIERNALPLRHANTGVTLAGQAYLTFELGRYAEARRVFTQSHEMLDTRLEAQTVAGLRLQAMLDLVEGHYISGNGALARAAALAQRFLPKDHPFFAGVNSTAAEMDIARGDLRTGELACKQAVELISARLGSEHPALARVYDTWGQICALQSNRPDALKYFEQARDLIKSKSPEVARSMAGIASLATRRSWRESVTEYRKAIAWDNEIFNALAPEPTAESPDPPPPHLEIARYLQGLGQLYSTFGASPADLDQAATCFKQSLEIREAQLDPNHPEIAAVLDDYAVLLRKREDEAQAEPLEQRAKEIRARIKADHEAQSKNDPAKNGAPAKSSAPGKGETGQPEGDEPSK